MAGHDKASAVNLPALAEAAVPRSHDMLAGPRVAASAASVHFVWL